MVEGSDIFKGSTKRLIKYSGKFSNVLFWLALFLPASRQTSHCSLPAHLSRQAAQWAFMLG